MEGSVRGLVVMLVAAGCAGDRPGTGQTTKPTTGGLVDADFDGSPEGEDCDDGDPRRFPGALDPWYDGIDQDCAGNDDYDQDGDGHASALHGGDDCDDLDPGLAPSLAEVPYDGVDQDCDPATPDDDLDGDGFLVAEDCADDDPDRSPGTLELLDDGVDQDCDGEIDRAAWGFDDLSFTTPGRPTLGITKDHVVLAVVADAVDSPSRPTLTKIAHPGLLLSLDPLAINGAPLAVEPEAWYGPYDPDPVGSADLHASGTTAQLATVYESSINSWSYLALRPYSWVGPGIGWFAETPSYRGDSLSSWSFVDLRARADGLTELCGSDADSVGTMRVDAGQVSGSTVRGVDGSRGCVWTTDDQLTTLSADGAATTWDVDAAGVPTVSPDQPFADGTWLLGHERDGIAVLVGVDRGLRVVGPDGATDWLDGYEIEDAEISTGADGTTWIAAVANRGGADEVLLLSSSAGGEVERWLDVRDGGQILRPTGISVLVTLDRVIVAVSAVDSSGSGQDRVGWALYGL